MLRQRDNPDSLLFQTGFEPATRGLPADAHEIFTGVDHSLAPPNDWNAFRGHLPPLHPWADPAGPLAKDAPGAPGQPRLGYFDIQYLGGTVAERFARIIEDPTHPGNHVLHFSITRANEKFPGGAKARVQASLYKNRGLTQMSSRLKMYLHPDLEVLRGWEVGFDWLTLQELWFGPSWEGGQHPFRISLGLCRAPGAGQELHFNIHGQPTWEEGMPVFPKYPDWGWPTWELVQQDFAVPTGVWLECQTCYRMGNGITGRFCYRVRVNGGTWVSIFDVTNWTYNPRSPVPIPLTDWNPMKLYTSSALVDYVRNRGGIAQIYWDDFAVSSDWPSEQRTPE